MLVAFLSYAVMHGCWNEDPEQRPTFANLVRHIADVLEREAGYTILSPNAVEKIAIEEGKEKKQEHLELNENEYEEFQEYETVL